MNGVISNGFAPRAFSTVGKRRLGELHMTARAPGQHLTRLAAASLSMVFVSEAAGDLDVAGAHLPDAAAMARAAHDMVGDAERVHDVEGQQRDMRRLEHVAAGVEHEIRRVTSGGLDRLSDFWPSRSSDPR